MITESKSKSGKIKRIFMRKEDDLCEHDINIKINKNICFCQNCGRITSIQKVKAHIIVKFLIKPKNYYKPIDFSPFILLKNISKNNSNISYNFSNFYLDFRNQQINVIYSLHKKFQSDSKTLFLSIQNLDRIFSSYKFKNLKEQKKITLITICTYIITYKFLEIDNYKYHLDYNYFKKKFNVSKEDIFLYELKCLKRLNYNIHFTDIYSILKIIMYIGFIFNNEDLGDISIIKIYKKIMNLLDQIIMEEKIIKKFSNKQIAFSIIYLIRKKFGLNEKIFKEEISENIYKYDFDSYEKCFKFIEEILDKKNTVNNEKDEIKNNEKENNIKVTSLSPETKSSSNDLKIKLLSQSLKPVKLKAIFSNNNYIEKSRNNSNLDKENKLYSPILFSHDNNNTNIKINLKTLKNKENIRYLLESQRNQNNNNSNNKNNNNNNEYNNDNNNDNDNNNLPFRKTSTRNISKKITFDSNSNNLFNSEIFNRKIIKVKTENFHNRILSDDNIIKFQKLREFEKTKVSLDSSINNENSVNKYKFNNLFNKSSKNVNTENNQTNNLKFTFHKNNKVDKIIFPHLN